MQGEAGKGRTEQEGKKKGEEGREEEAIGGPACPRKMGKLLLQPLLQPLMRLVANDDGSLRRAVSLPFAVTTMEASMSLIQQSLIHPRLPEGQELHRKNSKTDA